MTRSCIREIFAGLLIASLTGCSGYDRVLFMTKTNVGLDIDSQPPTSEVTIARRELAIQPIFSAYGTPKTEENDTKKVEESGLPLLATFGFTGNFFNPNITAHFAGGDAAVNLAPGNETNPVDSGLCLSKEPEDPRGLLLKFWHLITFQDYQKIKEEPRPFYFATDTSYGVKVAWSGTTGPYPDSLKLGYNRKEFASPPIFTGDENSCKYKDNHGHEKGGWKVKMPSFYAAIDNASGYTMFRESEVKHVQFFATGEAATRFAKDPYVRKIAFRQMAPEAAELKASELKLNEELMQDIKEVFDKADAGKRTEIMNAARTLKLVEDKTVDTDFVKELKKHSDSTDPNVSTNLIIVRRVAVAPPDEPADPAEPPTPEDPSAPTE